MARYNHFLLGLFPGLIIPGLFLWLYLWRLYPDYTNLRETIQHLYPSALLGKLLLLSSMADMVLVFIFYKSDSFKLAIGFLVGGIAYLIPSFFML